MKSIIGLAVILLMGSATLFAQNEGVSDKIKSMKIAYLTEKLDLSSKEAEAFWPIYNEYQEQLQLVKLDKRKNAVGIANKSDKQLEAMLNNNFDLEEQELKLHRDYYNKMKRVIPIKKVVALKKAEQEFKKYLLQQAREKRLNGQQRQQRRNFRN